MSTWNKNYHWKTKGCTAWAKQYFVDRLVGSQDVSNAANAGARMVLPSGHELKLTKLDSFEGDAELGNRKGKLITIYDIDMSLIWVAATTDGSQKTLASGKVRLPEVSHEIEDQGDEYTWETTLDPFDESVNAGSDVSQSKAQAQEAYKVVKGDFVKQQILPVLEAFRTTLVDTHARDLGHAEGSAPSPSTSGTTTPQATPAAAPASTPSVPKATVTPVSKSSVTVSKEAVELEGRNACSKEDLWDLLTNQARIPMWTRAPAQFVPLPAHKFSLFNGNVTGEVLSASSPDELVMSWRPPTWQPADHFGKLTMKLVQGEDATTLKLNLTGVPEGDEGSSKAALEEFYLNGLRRLGLGTMM